MNILYTPSQCHENVRKCESASLLQPRANLPSTDEKNVMAGGVGPLASLSVGSAHPLICKYSTLVRRRQCLSRASGIWQRLPRPPVNKTGCLTIPVTVPHKTRTNDFRVRRRVIPTLCGRRVVPQPFTRNTPDTARAHAYWACACQTPPDHQTNKCRPIEHGLRWRSIRIAVPASNSRV